MKRLIIAFLSLLLLCACVPTPEKEAIINKSEHSIKDTLSAPDAESYRYEAPKAPVTMISASIISYSTIWTDSLRM